MFPLHWMPSARYSLIPNFPQRDIPSHWYSLSHVFPQIDVASALCSLTPIFLSAVLHQPFVSFSPMFPRSGMCSLMHVFPSTVFPPPDLNLARNHLSYVFPQSVRYFQKDSVSFISQDHFGVKNISSLCLSNCICLFLLPDHACSLQHRIWTEL